MMSKLFYRAHTGGGTKFDVGHFSRAHVLPWALLFRARSACSDSQRAFSAPVNRRRRTFSALMLTLLAWSRLSTWPYTSSGQAHLARPAGGAPRGGWGEDELFVPHMTLRRPLPRKLDGYCRYTSNQVTGPLPAVIHVVGLLRAGVPPGVSPIGPRPVVIRRAPERRETLHRPGK